MRDEQWAGDILVGEELARRGHAAQGGVIAAVNMAREDEANPHGVRGRRWVAAEPGKPAAIGSGQHGGWGRDETNPFLLVNFPSIAPATLEHPTCITDIAPTILEYLSLPAGACDGTSLLGAAFASA
jgi:hypothetical protein